MYTHGFAGLAGGLLVAVFAYLQMALGYKAVGSPGHLHYIATGGAAGVVHGNWTLLKWQFFAALFVIVWSGVVTFILLKLVGSRHPAADVDRRTWRSATWPSTGTRCTPRTCHRSATPEERPRGWAGAGAGANPGVARPSGRQ